MIPLLEIGLPNLSDDTIEYLAEECEKEVSRYIIEHIPKKSIEQIVVTCMLVVEDDQLDVSIDIDLVQEYETGHDLSSIANEATTHAISWIEQELREMKM